MFSSSWQVDQQHVSHNDVTVCVTPVCACLCVSGSATVPHYVGLGILGSIRIY
jgi:hypothetical protein